MFKKLFGFGRKKDKELEAEVETKVEDDVEPEEVGDETNESQEEETDDQEETQAEEVQNQEEIQNEVIQDQDETQAQAQEASNKETETKPDIQGKEAEISTEKSYESEVVAETEAETETEVTPEVSVDKAEVDESDIQEEIEQAEVETEIQEAEAEIQEAAVEKPAFKGFFSRLKEGLSKTTQNFTSKLDNLFKGYKTIDAEIYEELEELLITADVGFETTLKITEELRRRERENKIEEVEKLQEELEKIIEEILVKTDEAEEALTKDDASVQKKQKVMVVVGVNGVGKTTSIGKLAFQLKNEGNKVMLAAADTFRAAATEQLVIWAERADVPIVKHGEGADPSAVIFDAIKSAKSQNTDILICDTAGRLHNKKNLMNELEKVFKIINREFPEAEKEVLLVIDATTGQNAINQAKVFKEAAPLTGLILTKLDGTAKGGVVLGIISELSLPIKYIGVGEKIEDLQIFDAKAFAKALFGRNI